MEMGNLVGLDNALARWCGAPKRGRLGGEVDSLLTALARLSGQFCYCSLFNSLKTNPPTLVGVWSSYSTPRVSSSILFFSISWTPCTSTVCQSVTSIRCSILCGEWPQGS